MKYNAGDFLSCECKDDHKYCVIGKGEENGYSFYILRNYEKKSEETLLVDFVDSKFKKIDMSFFKKWILYFILVIFSKGEQ